MRNFKFKRSHLNILYLLIIISTLSVIFQNFISTTGAIGGNGHTSSWDNRWTIITRGDPANAVDLNKPPSKWDLCLFKPENTKAVYPSGAADEFARKIIDVKSSFTNCITMMSIRSPGSNTGYIPVIKSDGTADMSAPAAYSSVIFEMNALAVAPVGGNPISNPFKSDINGNSLSGGTFTTYDFFLYTQVYHLDPYASNPATVAYPGYTMGVMRMKIVIENAFTTTPVLRNVILVNDWQPLLTGGNIFTAIEPSVTVDGSLMVMQNFPFSDDGSIVYIVNPTPSNHATWSVKRNITGLYEDGTVIGGQTLQSRYPIARKPIRSNLGATYSPNQTMQGAYPWISWEGTDLSFAATSAMLDTDHSNNALRGGWAIVGESTGNQIRLVDGAFRDYGINGISQNLVLFTSGIGSTSSVWNPYKELTNPIFPQINDRPVTLFFHSNGAEASEVSFKAYRDGQYLTYLDMNNAIHQLFNDTPHNQNIQYDFTRTPDTSGHNNYGNLLLGATIPRSDRATANATEFYGQQAVFLPQSSIEVDFPPSQLNKSQFSVEMMLKPYIDVNNSSDGVNKYVHLTTLSGVITVDLEETRQLNVTLHGSTNFKTGAISNSTLPVLKWTHIGVTWNEVSGILQVFVNANKVYEKILPAGFKVKGPVADSRGFGNIMIGPQATSAGGTLLIPGHDNSKYFLAMDSFKFSNIVRSADEFADSAFIPPAKRSLPTLAAGLNTSIPNTKLRVMDVEYTQEAAQLGSLLFRDNQLSSGSKFACMSCHDPAKGFSDGFARRAGLTGTLLPFNSPTLFNRATGYYQTWGGNFTSSTQQMWLPLTHSNEMGFTVSGTVTFLNSKPDYVSRFQNVFGTAPNPTNIQQAISAFINSIFTSKSKYDRVLADESGYAFTSAELAGKKLFFGKARCVACHNGVNFTDEQFHNTGIFTTGDFGQNKVTGRNEDIRKVKTPTLRNLSLTGPYFHDGSSTTMAAVIARYISAASGNNPLKDSEMKPISLTATESSQLESFLDTLDSGVTYAFSINMNEALPGSGPSVPGVPTFGTLTRGNNECIVNFTPPTFDGGSPITRYDVQVYNSSTNAIVFTFSDTASPFTITGLVNGVSYYFKIRAVNAIGAGSYSAKSAVVTPATKPNAPTTVTATAAAQATVTFAAPSNDGGSDVIDYEVTAYASGSTTASVTKTGVTATNTTVTGLTGGTSYTFKVRARNSIGYSSFSTASNAVTPISATTPGAPTAVTATAGNTQATVNFKAPTNSGGSAIIDYEVRAYAEGSTTVSIIKTGVTTTSTTITGLINGTSYTFKVRARNSAGYSPYSNASTEVTPMAPNLSYSAGSLTMVAGETRFASNLYMVYKTDGNLVIYNTSNTALWSSNSPRTCTSGCTAKFQADGNLVLYQNGTFYWASNTVAPNTTLKITATAPYISIVSNTFNIPLFNGTDRNLTDMTFAPGQFVIYTNSHRTSSTVKIILQSSGNLMVYNSAGAILWESGTGGRTCGNDCYAIFQSDGNLVLYQGGAYYWASNTGSITGLTLWISAGSPPISLRSASGIVW